MAEHLIRNEKVVGSTPTISSIKIETAMTVSIFMEYEQKEWAHNLLAVKKSRVGST